MYVCDYTFEARASWSAKGHCVYLKKVKRKLRLKLNCLCACVEKNFVQNSK